MQIRHRILDDKIFIKFNTPERDLFYNTVARIKQIPSRKFETNTTEWSFDYCLPVIEHLKDLFPEYPFPDPLGDKEENKFFDSILPLMQHQKESASFFLQRNISADLSDPGTGKTLTAIELIIQRGLYPVLVIAPISLMEAVWEEEIKKWIKNDLKINILLGTKKQRLEKLKEFAHIYVINYEYIKSLFFNKTNLNKEFLNKNFRFLILDESTKIKTHSSQRSKAIRKIADLIEYKHIMTGTLAPNGLLDVYHQFRILSPRLFGKGFYTFVNNYFYKGGFKNHEWIPLNKTEGIIQSIISKVSMQHKKRNCSDLPPLTQEKRFYYMSEEHHSKYKFLKEEAIFELENQEVITTPFLVSKLSKLSQLASGFIYDEQKNPRWITDEKIKSTIEIGEYINGKVIIFCHYRASVEKLMLYLKNSAICFYGGMSPNSKLNAIEQFAKSKNIKYLVANMASAGHGLNLQFCSHIIYHELDYNYENFDQSMQRIERIGQQNKMTVYFNLTKNTVQEYILKKLRQKKNLNNRISIAEFKSALKNQ